MSDLRHGLRHAGASGRVALGIVLGTLAGGCRADRPAPPEGRATPMVPVAHAEIQEGVEVGHRPPAFSVQDLTGRSHTLAAYAGQILVLHFWATWCPFCRGEIPKLLQVHERFGDQGVAILTVSTDEDLGALLQFVEERELPYAVVHDARSPDSLATRYGVQGIPVTVLIGRDGRVASYLRGSSDLVAAIDWLLSVSPEAPST